MSIHTYNTIIKHLYKKYKKESIKYHPDKIKSKQNTVELEAKFKEITQA